MAYTLFSNPKTETYVCVKQEYVFLSSVINRDLKWRVLPLQGSHFRAFIVLTSNKGNHYHFP